MTLEEKVRNLANHLLPTMLKIGLLVFSIEMAIMLFIPLFGEFRTPLLEALLDSSILALVVTPLAYMVIHRRGNVLLELPHGDLAVQDYTARMIKLFAPPFALVVIVVGLVMTGVYRTDLADIQKGLQQNSERIHQIQLRNLRHRLDMVFSDLTYLSSHFETYRGTQDRLYHQLAGDSSTFLTSTRRYGQLRFIDPEGRERLRLEYMGDRAFRVPDEHLQDFSQSEMFRALADLPAKGLYIDQLGQHQFRDGSTYAALRFGMPALGQNGEVLGMMVVDYLVDRMVHSLSELQAQSRGHLLLLDQKAQIIFRASGMAGLIDPAQGLIGDESGAQAQRGEDFRQQFPQAAGSLEVDPDAPRKMLRTEQGWFLIDPVDYEWAYRRYLGLALQQDRATYGAQGVTLVGWIPADYLAEQVWQLKLKAGIFFLVLVFGLGAVIFMAINLWLQREAQELELIRAKEKAEAATRAKSEFLANMSHEIRTPMNAILGFSEILRHRIHDPHNREYLSSIDTAGKALLELIDDILDLSKVEAGKLNLEPRALSMRKVLDELRQIFSAKLKDKNLSLTLELDPDLPAALLLDETRLRQLLLNLVGNAFKFTDAGGILVRVEVLEHRERQVDLRFLVADTGIGIAKAHCDQVFGAFEQQPGQSHAQFGGTGLGLAICRRLVKMMGGEIWVESDLGEGCDFFFTLPRVGVAEEADLPEPEPTDDGLDKIRFEPARLLLVDDIPVNRDLIRGYLEDQPFEFIEASDGVEAIEACREHLPDLVLMDFKMPHLDGLSATMRLKEGYSTAQIPVLAVTASVIRPAEEEVRRHFAGYLHKPVSRAQLFLHLMQHLPYVSLEDPTAVQRARSGPAKPRPEVFLADPQRAGWLLEQLKGPYWERYEALRAAMVINQVEDFARDLVQLGREGGCAGIAEWAGELESAAQLFNMEALNPLLDEYPEWVENIEELLP